jgi:hypothetical protein
MPGVPTTVTVAPLEGRESKPQKRMEIMDAASRNLIFIAGLLYEGTVTIAEGQSATIGREKRYCTEVQYLSF